MRRIPLRHKKRVVTAAALILVFLAILTAGCQKRALDMEQYGDDERIVIKFSHVVSEFTPKGLAARRFAELVHERTQGRVEVQVYPNSQLYMDGEEVDALINNHVQMIAPATAKMTEYFPELLFFDLPYLFENYEQVHEFIDSSYGKKLLQSFRTQGILTLAMWDNGFKVMTSNRPLRMPEDFSGLRFRIMPSRVLVEQFVQLGAEARDLPFSDVYAALEKKEVDAAENTPSNIYSKRFYLVQAHMTVSNHGYLGYLVLTNETFWMSLPEDIRVILETTLEEVTEWERQIAQEQNERDLRLIVKSGQIDVHYLSEAEKMAWRDALTPLHNKFLQDTDIQLFKSQ